MKYFVDEKLKLNIHNKLKSTFKKTIDNPVVKAHESWAIISDQLHTILGPEVHTQWFKKTTPLILKDNILILKTETKFAASWINTHYSELVDLLISAQDKELSSFFIAPTDSSYLKIPERK